MVRLAVGILQVITLMIVSTSTDVAILNSELLLLGTPNVSGFDIQPQDKPIRDFAVSVCIGFNSVTGALLLLFPTLLSWDEDIRRLSDVYVLATETIKHLKQASVDIRLVNSTRELQRFVSSFVHREFASVVKVEEDFRNVVSKKALRAQLPSFRETNVAVQKEIVEYRNDLHNLRNEEQSSRRSVSSNTGTQ